MWSFPRHPFNKSEAQVNKTEKLGGISEFSKNTKLYMYSSTFVRMRIALEVKYLIILTVWRSIIILDAHPSMFFCLVTDNNWAAVCQNGVSYESCSETMMCYWIHPCEKITLIDIYPCLLNICGDETVDVSTVDDG